MMGAILADTAHEELLDAALIVLGHYHSWSLQVVSSGTDNLTNGILVCVEVCYLNLMGDLLRLSLGSKPLPYKGLCLTDLQYVVHISGQD